MKRRRNTRSRRISPLRLIAVVAVTAVVVYAGARFFRSAYRDVTRTASDTWFAPYVDVTNTPTYHFEDPLENPAKSVVLSFVVAAPDDECSPSWGGYYGLNEAERSLDLDRRIARYRAREGTIVVSFGGAANNELAVACTDTNALRTAYAEVIDRYDLKVIDLDIEGAALTDAAANERRAKALAAVQQARRDAGSNLEVWLTLPVAPTGLTTEGVQLVDTTLAGGVDLAGVNAMTMNYGQSRTSTQSLHAANAAALDSTFRQLKGAFDRVGQVFSSKEVWNRIGATPMIGQNDVETDSFGVNDAERLRVLAEDRKLGRISMWSLNRDSQCGAQLDDVNVSTVCSGIDQKPRAFSFEFTVLQGQLATDAKPAQESTQSRAQENRDDPEASPYPIWRTEKIYEQGNKIVWHQNVYEAKWWNEGEPPDAPVENLWDTPWRYLGPVLETDTAATLITVPAGTYKAWDKLATYSAGDRVLFEGQAYEARRQNRDERPTFDPDIPQETPWIALDPLTLE